jgi:enoyl-[acyl-carrier protein] reductase II
MRAVRSATLRPFGVDLLTALPEHVERNLETVIAEGATLYVAGLGVPAEVVVRLHDAGVLVGSVCGTARHAEKSVDAGCDLVIAQGTEAGGHTGSVATMALVPAVVDAVGERVPVVAAGGIADGRGLAAALALGADGVWIGTRFVATPEARRLAGFTEAVLATPEDGTVITRAYSGKTMRVVPNRWTAHYDQHPDDLQPFPAQMAHAVRSGATHLGASETTEVDPTIEGYLCGQAAGVVHAVAPAAEVVWDMVAQAARILGHLADHLERA